MDGGEERHAVVYAAQPTAAGVFLRQRGTGHCAWRAGGAAELKRHGKHALARLAVNFIATMQRQRVA